MGELPRGQTESGRRAPVKNKSPRVGFAGVGAIGRRRLESVATAGNITVAAIADPQPAQLDAAKKLAPQAKAVRSFDELLAQDLDAVVIATPTGQHAEQAIAALNAGLAVFCQKPLGRDVHEVEAIVGAARRADRLLATDLTYRHSAAFEALHALTTEGALGRVYAARFAFHTAVGPGQPWFYDPRVSGGGCLLDVGMHVVDLALWLMPGEGVADVDCHAFSKGVPLGRDEGVEDYVAARLTIDNGANIEVACSWNLHAGEEAVIEADVFGTKGGASVRNLEGSFIELAAYRHDGATTKVVTEPPDAFVGRAISTWADRVAAGEHFDPECRSLVTLAAVLDALYARSRR